MPKLSPRAARVKAASQAAFGARGLSRLAEVAGVSKQLLSFIVAGDREVTDDVYRKIIRALFKEATRMYESARKIELIAGKMLAELEE
jgi:hypothetical protein